MSTGMIFDGMRRKGYVPERQYVSAGLRFWYRPLTSPVRAAYLETLDRQTLAVDRETITAAMMSRQLIEWDLKYPADWPQKELVEKGVPCNDPDLMVKSIDPYLLKIVAAIIAGLMASAMDPKDSQAARDKDGALQGLTAKQAIAALDAAEAGRVGNSSAA